MHGVWYTVSLCHCPRSMETLYRRANLEMPFANRATIVHGIECSNLVHAHRWHFENFCDFIHDTDTRKAMLPLSQIKQWHDCSFLVLRGVSRDNLLDERL